MTEKKTKIVMLRLSEKDYEHLKQYALAVDIPMADILRAQVRKLPYSDQTK